ncbi:MAG: bifunctional nuclease domain-containing protein [bacterium]
MRARVLVVLVLFLLGWLATPGCKSSEPDLLLVKVKAVMLDPQTGSPVLFLVDEKSGRGLPVWIGMNEARSITMEMQGVAPPRPLTHDLLKQILDLSETRVEKVVLTDLQENTYIAVLSLRAGSKHWDLDSRPSDAIALALKSEAPIYVSRKLRETGAFVSLQDSPFLAPVELRLGFGAQDLSSELAEYFRLEGKKGVLLTEVTPESAADKAGMRKADLLVAIDGDPIESVGELRSVLEEKESKESMQVELYRSGKTVLSKLQPKQSE